MDAVELFTILRAKLEILSPASIEAIFKEGSLLLSLTSFHSIQSSPQQRILHHLVRTLQSFALHPHPISQLFSNFTLQ